MLTVVLIVLLILAIGAMPNWGYSNGWGYGPSGLIGILLVILLVLMIAGYLPT